jgi:hypothetical protein
VGGWQRPHEQAAKIGGALHGQAGEVGAAGELALLRHTLGVAPGRLRDDAVSHAVQASWTGR